MLDSIAIKVTRKILSNPILARSADIARASPSSELTTKQFQWFQSALGKFNQISRALPTSWWTRWPLGSYRTGQNFSGTFLIMAICTWDRPPSPPPPRVAGQCEAQRVFCSLRLISLLDLAGNAPLGRDRKQKKEAAGARRCWRDTGVSPSPRPDKRGDVVRQLARFFR
jgi:hypothetical protein